MAQRCGESPSRRKEKLEAAERPHARLSPSSAHRWLNCRGSVNFIEQYGEDDGGTPADEGTILHNLAEHCLRTGEEPHDFVGQVHRYGPTELEITDRHATAILNGLDAIDEFPGKLHIEHRVDLGRWMPGQFGTLDVGICGRKEIVIWDWKFGGNPVSPVENDQLMIYGLGFWHNIARHHTDAERFRLIIEQPFAPGGGGEWIIYLDDLLDFGDRLERLAAETYDPNAPRTPGTKQCQWCPGAKHLTCPEYEAFNLNLIIDDFDELDEAEELDIPPRLPSPRTMTPERRSYILRHRPMFEKYLERLHADALDDALRGDKVPGLKAVYGRNPPRKWKDEDTARPVILNIIDEEDAFTRKLVSPTQAEKLLPPKMYSKIKKLVDHGEPKPILVSDQDERDPVPTIVDLFDD